MRDHAKASTAGSTKRRAKGLGRFFGGSDATRGASPGSDGSSAPKARRIAFPLAVFAIGLALALAVGSASGSTTRFFVEVFGSAAQPSFSADHALAVEQGTGDLHVLDSTADTVSRFNPNGTAADFSALSGNVIDGEGGADATPQGHLAFNFARQREQIALDESGGATDGDIYATQYEKDVVDVFAATGEYLGQLSESSSGGVFDEPCGVAVDSAGTVYVADRSEDEIHVYEPAANPVANADNSANFATVTDPCQIAAGSGATAGFIFVATYFGETLQKVDAASGEVKYQVASGVSGVSVDPGTGHVFITHGCCSTSTVEEYDASGAASASLVSSFKPGSTAEGVAVNSAAEEVYVAREGTSNVQVFGPAAVIPDVVTSPPSSNTGTRATLAGTVNPDGVELEDCFFEWGEGALGTSYTNTVPCAETPAEIGAGTSPVAVHADISGLKPQGVFYHYRLVAKNPNATIQGANQQFLTPNTVIAEAATGMTPTEATLNGTVNPDTATISECVFEWGMPKEPGESIQKFPETAPCVPGPAGITGESPVPVEAQISGLHPGTTYVYRLKATYPTGPVINPAGTPFTVRTLGPVIAGTWSEDVIVTEAILKAAINPEGNATTYHFEYGTTAAYGSQTPELDVGSDSSLHEVTSFLEGLQPGTEYHYRVVATNSDAVNQGPDRQFRTFRRFVADTDCPNQVFRYGASANLPDCRAYEMVSPVDKGGRGIIPGAQNLGGLGPRAAFEKASIEGEKLTYSSATSFGDEPSNRNGNQYLATRGPDGWTTHGISPRQGNTVLSGFALVSNFTFDTQYQDFSEDLSTGWLKDGNVDPLSSAAPPNFGNLYVRDNTTGTYAPLITSPPLAWDEFESVEGSYGRLLGLLRGVLGHSKDGSHVVFKAQAQLTPDSPSDFSYQLFDRASDGLHYLSVLPGGEPAHRAVLGTHEILGVGTEEDANVYRAVSEDGSVIFWSNTKPTQAVGLYARVDNQVTVPIAEKDSTELLRFWTASGDGSTAIYSFDPNGPSDAIGQELYEFDLDSETSTLIAHNIRGVSAADKDLSHLYFVSTDALAPGATAGEDNLYVRHNGVFTFIATVAPDDTSSLHPSLTGLVPSLAGTRVTPDGTHLAFMSNRPLTGYDNTDAVSGESDNEVFLYDAVSGNLTCVSCNPSGARPVGGPTKGNFLARPPEEPASSWWTAAWIPGWERGLYAKRVLSDDGNRLYFNAIDALVPHDTNGHTDVYQWEADGTGTCHKAGGCIDLVSTGKSANFSEFVDASPDGRDVFFRTESSIDPRDPFMMDIYDARAGGGYPPPPPPPPPCVGDACQNVSAAPSNPTPASAVFRGQGNPRPTRDCGAQGRRAIQLSHRAKRLRRLARRKARHHADPRRARRMRGRARAFAKRAHRLSLNAKRCRRAKRRAGR